MEMEVDEGVGGGGSGGGEGGSGVGESVETVKKNSPELEAKGKRKMKTPSQLEVLEKTYASEFRIVSLSLSISLFKIQAFTTIMFSFQNEFSVFTYYSQFKLTFVCVCVCVCICLQID